MKKRLFSLTALLLGIYLAFNLARGVWEAYKNKSKLDQAQSKLENLQKENADLKKELEFKKSAFFVEKEALDKLNLIKKGESVVILPEAQGQTKKKNSPEILSNPQMWYRLFFND